MARRAKRKRNVGWFLLEPPRLASLGSPPNLGGEFFFVSPLEPAQNVIFNPLLIPPFGWVHRHTMKEQSKVQVVSSGESRRATLAEDVFFLHHLSRFDIDLAHVAVERY